MTKTPAYGLDASALTARANLDAAMEAINHQTPCANTAKHGDDLWYSMSPTSRNVAADKCYDCPVMQQCHAYAETAREKWGVWGGIDRTQNHAQDETQNYNQQTTINIQEIAS